MINTIAMAVTATVGVFTGLSVFLLIAERWLVNYGSCKIDVNHGEKEIVVEGGNTLLMLLQENGVSIPSACGGKGSCGYCRCTVLRGGGPVLPTEAPYLTRPEIRSGLRLACQVKVKQDIAITIPDFLETVRSMIRNRTYDANLRWRWITNQQEPPGPIDSSVPHLTEKEQQKVDAILARYTGGHGSIVAILQDVNRQFNYLPESVLRYLAVQLDRPLSDIYRVGTFYNAFSLTPRGKHIIKVCMGTACYVKRGDKILESVERKIGVACGGCTEDGLFSLETVSCIGCCGQAPSMLVDSEIYGYLIPDMIDGIIDKVAEGSSVR